MISLLIAWLVIGLTAILGMILEDRLMWKYKAPWKDDAYLSVAFLILGPITYLLCNLEEAYYDK